MKTTDENNAMNQQHEPRAQNAGNDVCRAEVTVGFPEETGSRLIVRNGRISGLMKRIGSKVCVCLDHEEVLSVMYEEDYDPQSTFSAYKARAKEYALSIFAAMRAVNERQRHHENGVAFVAKVVQQTIDGMTTTFLQELKLSRQE